MHSENKKEKGQRARSSPFASFTEYNFYTNIRSDTSTQKQSIKNTRSIGEEDKVEGE